MGREERAHWCIAIGVAIVEATVWTASIALGGVAPLFAAIAVQLASVIVVARPQRRRRVLAAAVSAAIPVIGPVAAALAVAVSGNGGRALLAGGHAEARRLDGRQIADALVTEIPACEALASPDREVRRKCLAKLARRATASDIALLRWARTRASGDVAVEIALTLEDIVTRFENRVSAARERAERTPGYETSASAFRALVAGITSGIVDEPAIARLANEARHHHEAARAADPDSARELLADRARLELAVERPEAALELLATDLRGDATLIELYKQAAYAARRFELTADLAYRRSRARARV